MPLSASPLDRCCFPEMAEVMEIALIRGELLLGLLLAAVSGCGGDFKDLHDLPLLNLGYAVTPVINFWFSPLVWFCIISVSNYSLVYFNLKKSHFVGADQKI